MSSADQDFQIVKHKRQRKLNRQTSRQHFHSETIDIPLPSSAKARITERILGIKAELSDSDLFASVQASLREAIELSKATDIQDIFCFGLGRLCDSLISKYQFAFLLKLRDVLNVRVNLYDPVFTSDDRELLTQFQCDVLVKNHEAKIRVSQHTLFYLPHCVKELTNNLLWSNWGLNLNYCLIMANSFTAIVENSSLSDLQQKANYIQKIVPYMVELPIVNNSKYYETFIDTALHIFPMHQLQLLNSEFWNPCEEPKYPHNDEFILNTEQ